MKVENDTFRAAHKDIDKIKESKKTYKKEREVLFTDRDPPMEPTYFKPPTEFEMQNYAELMEDENDEKGRLDTEMEFR